MPPYPLGPQVWPFALLLLLMLIPKSIKAILGAWLRWLGLAIAVLLLIPYLFS
ncbi:hypothetical protein ACFZDG_18395 [Kitasatospora xanthocidica]|uniref:hypothetical protein n=1 Tax=Kitasatospora xanthocidica TaxID=83382 RepID=UPI0036EEDCF6